MLPWSLQARDPLAGQVSIYRDEYGVPHIVGETEEATFFGYGYAQAQDHLEKMMIAVSRRPGAARGSARAFQALGDGYLQFIPYEYRWDGDYLQRLLRTKQTVVEHRDQIDPQVYRILSGFARGVNAYIEEHRARVPAWIDGITPEDVEALERSQYLRFYSIHEALSKLDDLPYSFPNLGSNQFAIAPAKSADGRDHPRRAHAHAVGQPLSELRGAPDHAREAGRGGHQLVRQSVLSGRI